MNSIEQRVTEVVMDALLDLGVPRTKIVSLDDPLMKHITGDDATFVLIPRVERELGIKSRAADWREVMTIRDAVAMLSALIRAAMT